MIPYGKQHIDDDDIKEVVNTLRSDFLTTGPKVREFEEAFARYVGAKYAVAVSNGTAALHVACLAAGLKRGDELITSAMTFAASANCALFCQATPVFADIDEKGLMDAQKTRALVNDMTKVIIPVHYTGLTCNMISINAIAKGITIIEDACHALGSTYAGKKVGCCQYSDMAVFSFHPVKHITTGEGGMITTNSKKLYDKLCLLRSHGIEKNNEKIMKESHGPWYHEMQMLGFNYRLTDIQCALGLSQLRKLDRFVSERQRIAKAYDDAFKGTAIEPLAKFSPHSSYHLYVIKAKDGKARLTLYSKLAKAGISAQVHYIPVYRHPFYVELGYKEGLCPKAEALYERVLSIPIYVGLSKKDQELVIKTCLS